MAQAQAHRLEKEIKDSSSSSSSLNSFKFNAQAPEFVPKSHISSTVTSTAQMPPISGYFYPCFNYLGGTDCSSDWFFVGDQDPATPFFISNPNASMTANCSKNVLTDDLRLKIVKQVEYQFSDMSLLANESMSRHINKDPAGFVPISVIASTKKMKSLNCNNQLISQALKSSSKLIVTEDGKKVKRKYPFTEKDKEDLQARTVVAENLPEDHYYPTLEKIFGVVGSVKNIRICHPQESISSRPKGDFFISNKLHAFVEYESPEIAEKAVEKLNDERNWRKGLRVRVLLRCSPKSVLKGRKSEFDGILDDDEIPLPCNSTEDSPQQHYPEALTECSGEENVVVAKEGGWSSRGRGKGRGRPQSHGGRGVIASSPQSGIGVVHCEASSAAKQVWKGPRMPDGTRGFGMGRGKPLAAVALAS